MKKIFLLLVTILLSACAMADEAIKLAVEKTDVKVFSEKKYFGLEDNQGNIIAQPNFQKLIRLGQTAWIAQQKNKYGIVDNSGNYIVPAKYRHVDRLTLNVVKLGNENDFAVYDEFGNTILKPEYSTINMLFGGMFLTKKNYKYGVADKNGKIILENVFDDIYMPKPNIMRIQYDGQWYEIEQIAGGNFFFPEDVKNIKENSDFKVTAFVKDPITASGYSAITFTDYFLKIFSSISPSHEETIDDLMLSQGADTVSIFMKFTWLPKYPYTFAKKYYQNLRTPNNGPLSDVKNELKQKIGS